MSRADELLAELHAAVDRLDLSLFETAASPEHKAPPTIEGAELGLVEAGARRALARRLAADAMSDIGAWVCAADSAGVERKRIAHLAAISRQGVYDILGAGER